MIAFHTAFVFPHFKFLQLGDPKIGGTPSFLGRHITVRYYLMRRDLDKIEGEQWLSNECFSDFHTSLFQLDENEQAQQKKKLAFFVNYLIESINNHFRQWLDRLFFLGLFCNRPLARLFARHILGNTTNSIRSDCNNVNIFHNRTINLLDFDNWIRSNVTVSTIMRTRRIPIVQHNHEAIRQLSLGNDMWGDNPPESLVHFRTLYLHQYAALPTNTQFVERGVKESGFVSLGRRGEEHRTILAIARGKDLPDAMLSGRKERQKENQEDEIRRYQLKGKRKTRELMKSISIHNEEMRLVKEMHSEHEYSQKRRRIRESLTNPSAQFKKKRIEKKVNCLKGSYSKNPQPNRFQRREGYTLTPLMQGKIQYGKLRKKYNMEAVSEELRKRSINHNHDTGWMEMIKLLKTHENSSNTNACEKYFFPLTTYANFIIE